MQTYRLAAELIFLREASANHILTVNFISHAASLKIQILLCL